MLKNRLVEALDQAKGERGLQKFLKDEPWLVWATFMSCGGHSEYVIPEFSLGGKYYADFVVMQSFSGGWNIAFIELEPVDENPFNKDGSPSKRLRGAIKQINDWQDFEKEQGAALRFQLADESKKRDTLYPERHLAREPRCPKMELRDPKTYLCCEYFIVMGRSSKLDEELIHAKSKFARHHNNVKLLTYDRFIDVAEKSISQYEYYQKRMIDEEDKLFLTKFAEDPAQFERQFAENHPNEIIVCGTPYKVHPIGDGEGCAIDVLGSSYEIFEDRLTFSLNRIESDGLGIPVAENLESLSAAIQLAEIHERFIHFHVHTNHSLDLVDECLQPLRDNPPYLIEQDSGEDE